MQIQKYEAVLEETMLAVILDDHSWRAAFKTTYRTNVSYEEKQQLWIQEIQNKMQDM